MNARRTTIMERAVAVLVGLALTLVASIVLPAQPAAAQPGALVVGGNLSDAGGLTVNNIAAWDTVDWSALSGPAGTGADQSVMALTIYDGQLIAGGSFIEAGGVPVSGIAAWDGTEWSPLVGASGIPGVTVAPLGFVSSLEVYGGDLYVAGSFPRAGGTLTVNNIARWDGTEWHALPGPSDTGAGPGAVWDLTVHDGELVVAGGFDQAGGLPVNSLAAWDGTGWSSLAMPSLQSLTILAATAYDGDLVVGAHYSANNFSVREVLRQDGAGWTAVGGSGGSALNGDIRALTVFDGNLYAGGGFTQIGSVTVNRVARWDGTDWSPLTGSSGTGTNSLVRAFAEFDGDLYVGGHFTQAGGVGANLLARWDGGDWSALPVQLSTTALNPAVFTLLAT